MADQNCFRIWISLSALLIIDYTKKIVFLHIALELILDNSKINFSFMLDSLPTESWEKQFNHILMFINRRPTAYFFWNQIIHFVGTCSNNSYPFHNHRMQSKIFLQCFQNYFYNCFTIFLHYFNNISTHYPLCRSSNIYPFHNHWMQMRSAFLGRKIENVEPNVPTFKKTIFLKIFLQYVNIIFTTFLHIICSNIYPFHNHWMQMRVAFLDHKIENVEPNVSTFKRTIFPKIFSLK